MWCVGLSQSIFLVINWKLRFFIGDLKENTHWDIVMLLEKLTNQGVS
jgi:hypothetical protein